MERDAFVAGVKPGGLTNNSQIKILVCYLLVSINQPVSFSSLNEALQQEGLANYFEFAEAIDDLSHAGHIVKTVIKNQERYKITPLGKAIAQTLKDDIPFTVKEKALIALQKVVNRKRSESENNVTITKVPDGYQMNLTVGDAGSDLMNLSIFVPTKKDCERIREHFYDNAMRIYEHIISLLLEKNQTD